MKIYSYYYLANIFRIVKLRKKMLVLGSVKYFVLICKTPPKSKAEVATRLLYINNNLLVFYYPIRLTLIEIKIST
jgi:hypothetical protein